MSYRSTTSPIRVVLRIADGPGPAFLVSAAEAIMQVVGAEICLVLAVKPVRERRSTVRRLLDRIDAAYDWCERHALRGGPAALATRSPRPWPEGVPRVLNAPLSEQVDAVKAARPDVLIDLVPEVASDRLPVPPAGRWRLRYGLGVHGARHAHLTRPPASGLAESMLSIEVSGRPDIEAELGVSALRRVGFARDRDAVYWRSSLLPARRLARLLAGGAPERSIAHEMRGHPRPEQPKGRAWANPPFVGLVITVADKAIERLLFRTGWLVLVRRREPTRELPRDLSGFQSIDAPAGRFYADPFILNSDDGPRLYVEDCPSGTHHGRISTLRMASDGRWALEGIALDDLEHRAYPHVLRTGAGLLVTPDSGRSGGVDLFLDRESGAGLERIGRCLEGVAASDPTVLWHEGRYWLFVSVTGHGMSPWDELNLYSAATLGDVWHPHPQNPVVADVRRARPAGRIIGRGDQWLRPGQDCSTVYGQRIEWSAITTLTPEEYEEHPIGSTEPDGVPGIRRTHTYTFDGSFEALDGYRRVFRLARLLRPFR